MATHRTKHKKLRSYSINYTISERFDDYCEENNLNKSALIENFMKTLVYDSDKSQFLIEKCGFETLGNSIMGETNLELSKMWISGIIIKSDLDGNLYHECTLFYPLSAEQGRNFTKKLYDDIINYIEDENISVTYDDLKSDMKKYLENYK